MAAAEDMVKLLQSTKNPFDLSHHMPEIVAGMVDIVKRVQILEGQVAELQGLGKLPTA